MEPLCCCENCRGGTTGLRLVTAQAARTARSVLPVREPHSRSLMRPLTLRTILVAIDLEGPSDVALDTAWRLAQAAGAKLHIMHVTPPDRREHGDAPATRVAASLRQVGVPENTASIHIIPGRPAESIRDAADRIRADVIVVGPHRATVPGRPLGGTAREIAETANVPCLVVMRPLGLPLEHVLVPVDQSDTARGALLAALSWASALRSRDRDHPTRLTALHVIASDEDAGGKMDSVDEELAIVRRDAGGWAGVAADGVAVQGPNTADTIVAYAEQHHAGLVVLGTRGLGLDHIRRLGSVSAAVSTSLPTPLLLVPPAVWRVHAGERPPGSSDDPRR